MKNEAKEKIRMYLENYEELKRNKDVIKSIDKNFFFELVDCLIEGYKEYEEENKRMKMGRELRFTPSINDKNTWFTGGRYGKSNR